MLVYPRALFKGFIQGLYLRALSKGFIKGFIYGLYLRALSEGSYPKDTND